MDPEAAYLHLWKEIQPLLSRSALWKNSLHRHLNDYDITTLEHYLPFLKQNMDSRISLLNGESILFWSQSAGTTGDRKLFPMTSTFRTQFQRTMHPMVHGFIKHYHNFLKHPVLYFAAADPGETTSVGIEIGFISNYNYRTIPGPLRSQYAFPREIFRDTATFAKCSPIYALEKDLSAMFAVTPLSFKQLINNMRANKEYILKSLTSKAPPEAGLPEPHISEERLAAVTSCLMNDDVRFKKLWPSLEFVCCWKTSVCAAHLKEISPYLENIDAIDAVYSATEGWMNVPLPEAGANPLHPGAHIFEFIEVGEEIRKDNLISPWDLKPGGLYEIFLTTAMGLIRYRLFDIIRCTGFFNKAPLIEFVHKSASIISLGLVSVSEAELMESFEQAGIEIPGHWRIAPNRQGSGLVLYGDLPGFISEKTLETADEILKNININYRIYTTNGTLSSLSYKLLPPEHPLWMPEECHAQRKPVFLLQRCPE